MERDYRDDRDNPEQIPVFKLDGRRNKMEFIRGFKQVADHLRSRTSYTLEYLDWLMRMNMELEQRGMNRIVSP